MSNSTSVPVKFSTHYDTLQVSRSASGAVVRAAYRALSQQYHPDKNPDSGAAAELMQKINHAYVTLSDPKLRKEHDVWINWREYELHDIRELNQLLNIIDPANNSVQAKKCTGWQQRRINNRRIARVSNGHSRWSDTNRIERRSGFGQGASAVSHSSAMMRHNMRKDKQVRLILECLIGFLILLVFIPWQNLLVKH